MMVLYIGRKIGKRGILAEHKLGIED